MKRNISILTVILLVVPLLSGFARKAEKYTDPTLPIEQRVDDLLKRMTLDEKIAQMDMVGVWSFDEFKESEMIRTTGVGAFIGEVTPERYNEVQALSEKSRLKIPMLVGVDAVHGYGVLQNRTIFPTSISMAATFNPELVNRAARIAAREIRSAGNQWTFAPTLDIVQDARFGRTGETYGECPFLTTAMARSAIRGYQNHENPQHRVAACVKHYVGGGASIGGVNHGNAEISDPEIYYLIYHAYRGNAMADPNAIQTAKQYLEKGMAMYPTDSKIIESLSEAYVFLGENPDNILTIVQQAAESDPTNADMWSALGVLYVSNNEYDKAIEAFTKMAELVPDSYVANNNLGIVYIKQAEAILEDVNSRAATFATQDEYDAELNKAFQVYAKAVPYLEKAYASDPTNVGTVELLKNVTFRIRDLDGMMAKYEKYNALFKSMTGGAQ